MSKRLTILLLMALIVRLGWVLVLLPCLGSQFYGNLDGDGYLVKWSNDFQNGLFLDNPGSVLRMPLYPGLIASISSLVSLLTDNQEILITVMQIWNVLLDLSALITVYVLVRKLVNERAASWPVRSMRSIHSRCTVCPCSERKSLKRRRWRFGCGAR